MSWGGEGSSLLAVPEQSFFFPPMAYFMMAPLRSSPVTSSRRHPLSPSRQLLSDPLHRRMPLLGWWHPTFLPPEASIALPRSRASALTSAVSSASHSPEAPPLHPPPGRRQSQRAGTLHLHQAAIRLAVRQPQYHHSGFRSLKGTLFRALVCV